MCNETNDNSTSQKQLNHATTQSNLQSTFMPNNNNLISGFSEDFLTSSKIEDLFIKG